MKKENNTHQQRMFENVDEILTPAEAMELLKISANVLYRLLASGQIPAYRQGRVWRIPKQGLISYINKEAKL